MGRRLCQNQSKETDLTKQDRGYASQIYKPGIRYMSIAQDINRYSDIYVSGTYQLGVNPVLDSDR